MTEYLLLSFAFATSAGLMFLSYRAFVKKRFVAAGTGLLASLPAIAFVALITSTIIDDGTIKRLTKEHALATITFQQVDTHHFRANFTEPHQKTVSFDLYGDQWQIDARVMKWNGSAARMGLKPVYQFERLSGRYQDARQEISGKRSVYALSDNNKVDSIWGYLIEYQSYIPWLDSQYGSATYMPMKNGAAFTIKLSNSGLLARPRNFIASQSVDQWL